MDLKAYIRDIPDFPSPGILFRDITTLTQEPQAFARVVDLLHDRCRDSNIDAVAAVDSRGFLFGAPLALRLGKPLALVRKRGKLPAATYSAEYSLEYGTDTLEIHRDAIGKGDRALVLDDLLATGGTLAAAAKLVEMSGGVVAGIGVVIELTGLQGRSLLAGYDVFSLVEY